jgi:hypothetical protein
MPMRKKRRWRRRRKKMEDAPSCTFTPAGRLQFQLGADSGGSPRRRRGVDGGRNPRIVGE